MSEGKCPSCAATLAAEARFCHRCGKPLDLATELASTQQALLADAMSGPLPPMRLPEGTTLGVYRVESVIGEGGMGVVYRGRDLALGRDVAIKCLHTNLAGDPEIRRRFVREANVLRSWRHP